MSNELYFASEAIAGINFDIFISDNRLRKILINKIPGSFEINNAIQVPSKDIKVSNVFNQLKEYFNKERKAFEIEIEIVGTEFQRHVWEDLTKIPYGATISYRQLAERIGNKNKIRAVAAANGANPIPIIIPCHRIIGTDGSLTGYAGGLNVKKKLLELEGSWAFDLNIPD